MSTLVALRATLVGMCRTGLGNSLDTEAKGLLLIVLSGVTFTAMSALIRGWTGDLPPLQVSMLRSALSLLLLYPLVARVGRFYLRSFMGWDYALRSSLGYFSFVIFVICLSKLPLAIVTAVFYTTPLWSIAFSSFLLKERGGRSTIAPVALGIAGMLAIIQPRIVGFDPWICLGLAGAALGSLAVTMVRHMSATETPERLAFGFMLWGTILGLPLAVPDWIWPAGPEWLSLAAIAALATVAQLALTHGLALAPLIRGAPFDFVRLPASLVIGVVVLGEPTTVPMWLGCALIALGSGLALLKREPT
jgi:drug/metabolite transporter (DMT)-like permease